MTDPFPTGALAPAALAERFAADGYVRIDRAVARPIVDECRSILWHATGCTPDDPATWT